MAENVDNTLLFDILKEIGKEVRDVRTLLLQTVDPTRRIERRVAEQRDDLELVIKSELMGALGNFETRVETRLDRIEKQIGVTDGSAH
jgi:hypothetical protein